MFVLPVPATTQDEAGRRATAEQWEQAAPNADHAPMLHDNGAVTRYRTGPGDVPHPRDEWLDPDIFVIGRQGVESGRQLFVGIPGPPPEGHGGYDVPLNVGPVIDHSTSRLALFWSDWQASTPQHACTGEHVIILRAVPGSTQGYMPADMVQPNNARAMPAPWDTALTVGQALMGG